MEFLLTPDEAQSTAAAVIAQFVAEKRAVAIEAAVDPHVSFRPTLTAEKDLLPVYVEAQYQPAYTTGVAELVSWASVQRIYCEIYVAVPLHESLTGHFLEQIARNGVGLILVDNDGTVSFHRQARNPALVVTPDPTLKFGRCASEVRAVVKRFNDVDRKGALQAMCEIVERETDALVKRLARKKWITKTVEEVDGMDWSSQINVSASASLHVAGKTPIVNDKTKTDLHSFRGARNLIDHKVKTKRAEKMRQTQFVERMLMGPRLTAELLSMQRKIL